MMYSPKINLLQSQSCLKNEPKIVEQVMTQRVT